MMLSDAQQIMVEENLGLIWSIVKRYTRTWGLFGQCSLAV